MDSLVRGGYAVVPLSRVLERRAAGEPADRSELAITFDDGYADNFELAAPVLAQHRFPATFFVAAGLIDGTFDHGPARLAALTRGQVAELSREPLFEVGSHGHTHVSLPELDRPTLERELTQSRRTLQDLTGKPVRWVAYPYGSFDETTVRVAESAGYEDGLTVWTRDEGRFRRLRIPISASDRVLGLGLKLGRLYFPLKRLFKR
ncbi:MAG: polysaccharide deacetylase family protein [Candidatus Riflebacteria bacterium]|nr:polysaccharide deacetylase family protein [Candidatus Riflebacteria bacterium]